MCCWFYGINGRGNKNGYNGGSWVFGTGTVLFFAFSLFLSASFFNIVNQLRDFLAAGAKGKERCFFLLEYEHYGSVYRRHQKE
jgi:hypothetical protein